MENTSSIRNVDPYPAAYDPSRQHSDAKKKKKSDGARKKKDSSDETNKDTQRDESSLGSQVDMRV